MIRGVEDSAAPRDPWHMHVGSHKLYIVGPGPRAMWGVTEPCYKGRVGTAEERRIVRIAVSILRDEQRDNVEATREIVMEAMRRARMPGAKEVGQPDTQPPPAPSAKSGPRLLIGDYSKRGWTKNRVNGFYINRKTGQTAKDPAERNRIDYEAGLISYATFGFQGKVIEVHETERRTA